MAALLAVTMLPAAGLQPAFADEPVDRPATSGGDVALQSTNGGENDGDAIAAEPQVPVAEGREDGMLAAGGLLYTVADGGLSLAGFEGDAPEGRLAVPAAVSVDGKETAVVAVDLAEGQLAEGVVALSLPQGIKDVNTGSLAAALPALMSVEVVAASVSSSPVAAGAASMRAAYSASGGMLFRPATVGIAGEDGTVESIECRELVWAPPALVSARVPVDCRSIAQGAFADARDLETVVAFGTMERVADGAFSTEQVDSTKVVVPGGSAAVVEEGVGRVSASMALMGDEGQRERRRAWHEAGWRSSDIVMGKPYGSLTETVAVTPEGAVERTDLMLISYPGMHPEATDVKHPGEDGKVDMADNGLAFTVKSDMTVSVAWQGDKSATPARVEIPAAVSIDDVTYPVTEIAPRAFEGASFLEDVDIPVTVATIGVHAFASCNNLDGRGGVEEGHDGATVTKSFGVEKDAIAVVDALTDGKPIVGSSLGVSSGDEATMLFDDESISHYGSVNNRTLKISLNYKANDVVTVTGYSGTSVDPASLDTQLVVLSVPADATLPIAWEATPTGNGGYAMHSRDSNGKTYGYAIFTPKPGFSAVSVHMPYDFSLAPNDGGTYVLRAWGLTNTAIMKFVRSESTGPVALSVEGHSHDVTDIVAGQFGTARIADMAITSAKIADGTIVTADIANGAITDDKLATKFGTIIYNGLDGEDASVYPTSYRKGGTPALSVPSKKGHEFAGWSWSRGDASGDSSNIANAFAEAGSVTLTANWTEATPEGNCFFAGSPLDSAATGAQTHIIAVKLTGDTSKTALKSVGFVGNDSMDLIADAHEANVSFALGTTRDNVGSGGTVAWGQSVSGNIPLGDIDGGKGLYVKVTIPDGAINKDNIVGSFTAEEYVASLVRLDYVFA